ncbi:MAG: hypothetical protein IPI11_02940 [Haliscomenobacter sp.]|nr:hypothetical protein [Haliscomenobacter sp.]
MKQPWIFISVVASLVLITLSCNRDKAIRDDAANSLKKPDTASDMLAPSTSPFPSANQNATATAGAVPHYICPNNCAGSGGAEQANCSVCGTAYVHNQAFHDQQASDQAAAMPVTPTTTTTTTPAPDPAQNAAGVWHYTCAKGCAGGSGTPGNCGSCGQALAHNAAYHN